MKKPDKNKLVQYSIEFDNEILAIKEYYGGGVKCMNVVYDFDSETADKFMRHIENTWMIIDSEFHASSEMYSYFSAFKDKYFLKANIYDNRKFSMKFRAPSIVTNEVMLKFIESEFSVFSEMMRGKDEFGMIYIDGDGDIGILYNQIKKYDVDIELNYGSEFVPIDKKIKKLIRTESGAMLFHGSPGTGKTVYIRHLISTIRDRSFIYVPSSTVPSLMHPGALGFIQENLRDCVIIVEDAESIIQRRDQDHHSEIVSFMLNLTDGIMGDFMNVSFILTYNCPQDEIDPALLRKGRLLYKYEFNLLSVADSNKLIKILGHKNFIAENPMSLADIYHLESDNNFKEKESKFGFINERAS